MQLVKLPNLLAVLTAVMMSFSCYAQLSKNLSYQEQLKFIDVARKYFNPSKAVKNECDWQYAVVKVKIDNENKVKSYKIINATKHDMSKAFNRIIGYKFKSNLPLYKSPIAFCVTIENEKDVCVLKGYTRNPSEVLMLLSSNLQQLYKINPNTIFIPNITMMVYSADSIE